MQQDGPTSKKPIVIVGAGFAGCTFLMHTLLKIADDPTITSPVNILLVERKPEQFYGGLAYGKAPAFRNHCLNIGAKRVNPFPAGQMPPGFPTFMQYLQEKIAGNPELENALTNPPRQMYGDYIHHLVDLAIQKAGNKVHVVKEFKDATDIAETRQGVRVGFADGTSADASSAILATGFQESLAPKFARAAENCNRFLTAPYSLQANGFFDRVMQTPKADVLIIGTGLTAMDCAVRLLKSGFSGQITMMSRRSLMHTPYQPTPVQEYVEKKLRGEPRPEADLPFTKTEPAFMRARTVKTLVRSAVREFRKLTAQGFTSEEILGYWERFVPAVAKRFPHADLAGLLAANDTLITASRVGVTPDTGQIVQKALEKGQITISAGSIHDVRERDGKVICHYTPSDGSVSITLKTHFNAKAQLRQEAAHDYAISAMGNTVTYDPAANDIRHPLWKKLITSGMATPHWTKMGIAVNDDFALLDKKGRASRHISVIGVPVAGHMMVTAYPYPEKPGAGGRLGPPAMNVAGITGAILAFLSSRYAQLTESYRVPKDGPLPAAQPVLLPAAKRKSLQQPP